MNEDIKQKCAECIDAATSWLLMPPDNNVPEVLEMTAYMGSGPLGTVLTARYKSDGAWRYDGTVTPTTNVFSMVHLTPDLSEKAFLKAETTLKK